ncbi:hypothetical protein, partial [Mycobacterium montefiorense]|uniref:hypothetical protein n=1 Tax=Mycobacterium montefiorense TaxID=154654 RepID=UPI00222F9116
DPANAVVDHWCLRHCSQYPILTLAQVAKIAAVAEAQGWVKSVVTDTTQRRSADDRTIGR